MSRASTTWASVRSVCGRVRARGEGAQRGGEGSQREGARDSRRAALRAVMAAVAVLAAGTAVDSAPAQAAEVAGMGNYCSITWSDGRWAFAFDSTGGDPCGWLAQKFSDQPDFTIARRGLYSGNSWNNAVVRCGAGAGWVGIYRGIGNGPLNAAFDSAVNSKLGFCVFTVAPMSMPVFTAPFNLAASYTHVSGFDFARSPYKTLNVGDFGQVGSSTATIVNWKGQDKSKGYIDDHAGNDWLMPTGTTIKAAADGVVVAARDWQSPCAGSESSVQKEVAIRHTVWGSNGYHEKFVTYYAHLSSYSVKEGDMVFQGQVIGASGNTGCSTAPHLHFATLRLTNTAGKRLETLTFYPDQKHSDGSRFVTDAFGFNAPKGFDPWAWQAYPAGALSISMWKAGQAPSTGNW